jgi:hypothetical protein
MNHCDQTLRISRDDSLDCEGVVGDERTTKANRSTQPDAESSKRYLSVPRRRSMVLWGTSVKGTPWSRQPNRSKWGWQYFSPVDRSPTSCVRVNVSKQRFEFCRRFKAQTSVTPARFVETQRLQAARHRLEGGASVKAAARAAGFASPEHLSRVFKRRLAMSPWNIGGRTSGSPWRSEQHWTRDNPTV